jgi:ATP-dependent helicase/nuclease subunit A
MQGSSILSKNIWISASAGSGKTKALIDRFLKLLLDGISPTEILCVTFTKAAAQEMLKRITDELTNWAICNEAELVDKVTKLIGTVPTSAIINLARNSFEKFIDARGEIYISTIHSFCQKLVEKYPLECNLELGAALADDQIIKTIIDEAKASFLKDDSIFSDESIQYLFEHLNEFKIDALLDCALTMHNLVPNVFMTREKLTGYMDSVRRVELKLPDNYSSKMALKATIDEIKRKIKEAQEANIIASALLNHDVTMPDEDIMEGLKDIFLTKKKTARMRVLDKDDITEESKLLIEDIQNLLLSYLENESAYRVYKQTFGFFSLGNLFLAHYRDIKSKHGALDYGDVIQRGVALLKGGGESAWLLYQLINRFHSILVDEAQDLSTMQWDFITALSDEFFYNYHTDDTKSIFIVGDPKQSIYSFQGASPSLFAETKGYIENFAKRYSIEITHKELNESFRSDPAILEFVDRVFHTLRTRNPEYFLEKTNHTSNKNFEKASIEIWPLVSAQKEEGPEDQWQNLMAYKEVESSSMVLAQQIVVRIKNLLQEGYLPSDIMILVRKRDMLVEQMVMELKSESIPISGVDRLILNKSLAIQDLLAIGKFLLSQYDDYNLACLLKSPFFSVTEDALFELCNRKSISLWENIKLQDKPEYKAIASFLGNLLENKNNYTPYQLFSYLLDVLQFRTTFLSRFGMQLNEILDEFLNVVMKFESKQFVSLSLFINWFEKSEIEIKRDSCDSNEVRLMTIHASKGLQAKVIILPDTTSVPKSNRDAVLYNTVIRKLIVHQGASDHPFCRNMLDIATLQTMQEYYRLLYVALTRAAEKLIICGWSNTEKINPNSWYALLDEVWNVNGMRKREIQVL